jgi:ureidoglycolate lyase
VKLLRYGESGQEKPGMLDRNGLIRDLSGHVNDISDETLLPVNIEKLKKIDFNNFPEVSGDVRIGPCVGKVGNFICIGLNYSDHAKESNMEVPKEPVIFSKITSSICGPNDDVIIPRNAIKTDWEVELGVVIGKTAKYVDEKDALDHIAGYCVINDLSD